MEREPAPQNQPTDKSDSQQDWSEKVERRELITLNAHQVDQMVASLGMCVAAIYELTEAMETEEDARFRRKLLRSARKSVEDASSFLEDLAADITK